MTKERIETLLDSLDRLGLEKDDGGPVDKQESTRSCVSLVSVI